MQNVTICHDNLIFQGKIKLEHDTALAEVVDKPREMGTRFHQGKIKYCQTQVRIMEYIFPEKDMEIHSDPV